VSNRYDWGAFRQRLAETIAWSSWEKDFEGSLELRTAALKPASILRDPPAGPDSGYGSSLHLDLALGDKAWQIRQSRLPAVLKAREAIVDYLACTRSAVLALREIRLATKSLDCGKLVLFDPDATLSDGAAEVASSGLFDMDNVPPWDCWITYVAHSGLPKPAAHWTQWESFLVAWIPPDKLEAANAGIRVIPEDCVADWSDVRCDWTASMKAQGFRAES
jgi:hypothetical protein